MQQTAEICTKNQISTVKKVPRGLVGLEVPVPPYSRVLCLLISVFVTGSGNYCRCKVSLEDIHRWAKNWVG